MADTRDASEHWDRVRAARDEVALTWFEAVPKLSQVLIARHGLPGKGVIDVGGSASRLVDHLLDAGTGPVAVPDLPAAALQASQDRLGPRAGEVTWIAGDVTRFDPTRQWGVWHGRAVFHFLTDPVQRLAYGRAMTAAVIEGGAAVIASFDADGPETCSGLPVRRWSPEALAVEIARVSDRTFAPVEARRHDHLTPKGNRQAFQTSVFRRH